MPEKFPNEEGEKAPRSKKISYRDSESSKSRFFSRFKEKIRSSDAGPDVADLASEMQKLGLEPEGLEKFIVSLHRLAVASKVDPLDLASLIKELSTLSKDGHLSVEKIRLGIHQLSAQRAELANEISKLKETRDKVEGHREVERENVLTREKLSHFQSVEKNLNEHGISIDDVSKLASMVTAAAQLGHSPTELSRLLTELENSREEKRRAEEELERLLDSKGITLQKIIALEGELAEKQKLLDSSRALTKLGFEPHDLDAIGSIVTMIARTRAIDQAEARRRLLSDIQSYYANDQELHTRLRTLEALVREKEDKIGMLDADLRNEKALLENASKLISSGLNEQWLVKLRSIIDAYGSDLDTLTQELQVRNGLSASIDELAKTKQALEEEERLLRQKVVATEDQRLRTLTMINELIVNASKTRAGQAVKTGSVSLASTAPNSQEFLVAAQESIGMILEKLPHDSPARIVLQHALLAFKLESRRA